MPMAHGPIAREQAAVARAAKVDAVISLLDHAVSELRSGDGWRGYLEFQSKLHDYSAKNVLLIAVQHMALYEQGKVVAPMPSYVASYRKWLEFGRQVEKGQTGLAVIAPMRGTRRVATDDDGKMIRVLGAGEQPDAGEREAKASFLRGFTVEKVFSAEQTTGAGLPSPPMPQLLAGQAPQGLGEAVMGLIEARGFSVATVPAASFLNGANGQTHWVDRTVLVREDMDDAAMVKTLLHEAGHVLLHDPRTDPGMANVSLPLKEVEAESVAFVVARVHGMATDNYSFPYIAAWAGGDDPRKAVTKTAQRVAEAAHAIIEASPADHLSGGKASLTLTPPTKTAEPNIGRERVGMPL
jgi:antirestriction protein ArdC